MQIFPLSEGSFTVDKSKQFIPFDTNVDQLNNKPIGSLLVEIQPFVIVTSNDVILLDTGLGFTTLDGSLQIHENLKKVGINPSQVTKVLMSHLHKDHAGGITMQGMNASEKFISFPYATYYLQEREYQYALENNTHSYIVEDFQILEDFSKVVWLQEDTGWINDNIAYQLTGGHCPFHQTFKIHDNKEIIFYGGDVAPQLQQMKSKFVAKYDYDGKKCMELRQEWWQQGKEENWTFLFYHDIHHPIWRF